MKSEEDTEKGYTLFIPNFPQSLRQELKIIAIKKNKGLQETIIEMLSIQVMELNT